MVKKVVRVNRFPWTETCRHTKFHPHKSNNGGPYVEHKRTRRTDGRTSLDRFRKQENTAIGRVDRQA